MIQFGDSIIKVDEDKCVGCNHCIRVCPIETANIGYQDEFGNTKVVIDQSQCISCGVCLNVCQHDARDYQDDIDLFFNDLKKGHKISMIVAPAIKQVFPNYQELLAWFKDEGVNLIYDVSLGADICTWGHIRYLDKTNKPLITQPCPVVVSFCEEHRHELLEYLSPIQSPMACTAIYMKKNGIEDSLASLSPCISKTREHRSTKLVQYNITFDKLKEYMHKNNIKLSTKKKDFDHYEAGAGGLYPLPGGLLENLRLFGKEDLYIEKREGTSMFGYLRLYSKTDVSQLPDVFDCLSCENGCLIGSGMTENQNIFSLGKKMNLKKLQYKNSIEERMKRLQEYDEILNLDDFLRSYQKNPYKYDLVSDERIESAFLMMKKNSHSKRNYNCGACGSKSCYDMARKIALGVNIHSNCMVLSKDEVKQEKERNADYLDLVRSIGDNLYQSVEENYSDEITESLKRLSESIDVEAVAIWSKDRNLVSSQWERVASYYKQGEKEIKIFGDWPSAWLESLENGETLCVKAYKDHPKLFTKDTELLIMVPIHIKGEFWGFVDAASYEDRIFSREETSLLEACGILLISGILDRQLTSNLHKTKEEALAASKSKSDFLSNMSHEIRTPMNAIIGMTSIGESANTIEKKDYAFNKIKDASTHLLGVINDILDMSKIEANKLELSIIDFNFEKMVHRVIGFISFKVEEKNQKLIVELDSKIPAYLKGDDNRIAQVITNLLANAVKFTPENGTIVFKAKYLGMKDNKHGIKAYVKDNGIGISEEQVKKLFTLFVQAESGISRTYGGTGLGLAISKSIVELMGGNIGVESIPKKGSTFSFDIWLDGSNQTTPNLAGNINIESMRILAVDDDIFVRDFFKHFSTTNNILIDTASNGPEALELIQKNGDYNLYFIDWDMPFMNGIEVVKKIRDDNPTKPIIAMISGLDLNLFEKEARGVGVEKLIQKPLFNYQIHNFILDCVGMENKDIKENENDGYLSNFTMLLAEDIEINREIVGALLEESGITIDNAVNGLEAFQMFKENPNKYDIIIMDLQMPVMDGLESARKIRNLDNKNSKKIPIIAMTANVFKEDIKNCLEAGMNDHIGKPINNEEFHTILKKYLL
ncbi:response regulator [Acholeplasma sp. OttesenSCG-928-E16]|nr:response regulator [Acholeplasma sp. OttesenSCG-928-E16]